MGKSLIVWALVLVAAVGAVMGVRAYGEARFSAGWEGGYAQARDDWRRPCVPDSAISGEREQP